MTALTALVGLGNVKRRIRNAIDGAKRKVKDAVVEIFRKIFEWLKPVLERLGLKAKDKIEPPEVACPDSTCFVAGTLVQTKPEPAPIEAFHVGRRVVAFTREDRGRNMVTERMLESAACRSVRLLLRKSTGGSVRVELLRSLHWIEDYGAHVGGSVYLDMPEMGAEGLAEVLAINPCPAIAVGPGRLVTATFAHTAGEVYDLKLESESEPLGVTGTHPFRPADRDAWIAAADLKPGERVQTVDGSTTVESRTLRPDPEPVYNIEVEADHVYRVGESGVLVHNNSAEVDVDACMRLLARRRAARGLSPVGEQPDDERKATFAVLYIGGRRFYGVNSFYQEPRTPITLKRVNVQTKPHAEAEAVQKAVNAGATDCTAVMCVDRPPCEACGPPRQGLRSLARNLGVQKLVVHSPRGREQFMPTT